MKLRELTASIKLDAGKALTDLKQVDRELDDAKRGLSDVEGGFDKVRKSAVRAGRVMRDVGQKVAGGIKIATAAVLAGTTAAFGFTKAWSDAAAELSVSAEQFDLTVGELQRLRGASELAGLGTDTITDGVKEFRKRLQEGREQGLTPFTEELAKLGLTVDDVDTDDIIGSISVVADRMAAASDGTDDATRRMRLFGEEAGVRLGPLLTGGSARLRGLISEFEELGIVLDERAIAEAGELNTEMARLGISFRANADIVARELGPVFIDISERTRDWLKGSRELIREKVPEFIGKIVELGSKLLPVLLKLIDLTNRLTESVGGLGNALTLAAGAWASFRLAGAAALGSLGPWVAGITAATTAVMAFGDAIDGAADKRDRLTKEGLRKAEFRRAGDLTQSELENTAIGREILGLEQDLKLVQDALETVGSSRARLEASKSRTFDEFGAEEDVRERERFEALDRRQEQLNALAAKTRSELQAKVQELRNVRAQAGQSIADAGLGQIARDFGAITEGRDLDGRPTPFTPLAKPKRIGENKGKKKRTGPLTLAEVLGVRDDGSSGSPIRPQGLNTAIFNIAFNIQVPSFDVVVQTPAGATAGQVVAEARTQLGNGIRNIATAALRSSVGQVLG